MQCYIASGTVTKVMDFMVNEKGKPYTYFNLRIKCINFKSNYFHINCAVAGDDLINKAHKILKVGNEIMIEGKLKSVYQPPNYSFRVDVKDMQLIVKGLGTKGNNNDTSFDATL